MTKPNSAAANPVRSMTGYARIRRQTAAGEITVGLRTVNHRALDFHFHQSSDLAIFENAVRALIKQKIARGHVEVRISFVREAAEPARASYDRALLQRYVSAYREAAVEFGIEAEPDLNAAFRLPGVLSVDSAAGEVDSSLEPEILAAVEQCAAELNAFREREGAQLAELLRIEAVSIGRNTARMKEIRSEALPHFQKRLSERLEELLGSTAVDVRRLAEEAAILADRSDIEEELARLHIHTEQLMQILNTGGEIGKKVDFLLQEMNRETNTVLSKTSGIGDAGLTITDLGLATKAHIDKIREQALNLE